MHEYLSTTALPRVPRCAPYLSPRRTHRPIPIRHLTQPLYTTQFYVSFGPQRASQTIQPPAVIGNTLGRTYDRTASSPMCAQDQYSRRTHPPIPIRRFIRPLHTAPDNSTYSLGLIALREFNEPITGRRWKNQRASGGTTIGLLIHPDAPPTYHHATHISHPHPTLDPASPHSASQFYEFVWPAARCARC